MSAVSRILFVIYTVAFSSSCTVGNKTVRLQTADFPATEAVTVVVPSATAVTVPASSTVAIFASPVVHTTSSAAAFSTLAVNCPSDTPK